MFSLMRQSFSEGRGCPVAEHPSPFPMHEQCVARCMSAFIPPFPLSNAPTRPGHVQETRFDSSEGLVKRGGTQCLLRWS